MRPVFITGLGHCSARGMSPGDAAASIAAGEKNFTHRELLGEVWPWHGLPLAPCSPTTPQQWGQRMQEVLRKVAQQAGFIQSDTVYLASSSFHLGEIELWTRHHQRLPELHGIHEFAERIAKWLGVSKVKCVSHFCISSFSAVDWAVTAIAHGQCDSALVVGMELINDATLAGFASLALVSPVHKDVPEGLQLGEAVAAIRLSATVGPWQVKACRQETDAYSPTSPNPDGTTIRKVMEDALAAAQLSTADIALIKLQSYAEGVTHQAELAALTKIFSSIPPTICLKPFLGHTLGASGMAELTAILAMRPAIRGNILCNLIGFGGGMACLIVGDTS